MIIQGRTSLLALIDAEKTRQGLSEREICRRAVLSLSAIYTLRSEQFRTMNMKTLIALVNSLGLVLTVAPE